MSEESLSFSQPSVAGTPSIAISPLPACVLGGPKDLSEGAREQIKALCGPRPITFLLYAAMTWAMIIGIIFVAVQINHIAFTVFACFLISTRQHMLGYLMHDQAHYLGFKTNYGDMLANVLVAYPLLVLTTEKYAQVHLLHHSKYFSEDDPDFIRKSGDEWAQPMTRMQLLKLLARDLFAFNVLAMIRGKKVPQSTEPFPRRWPVPAWMRPAYFAMVAVLLTVFGGWELFLIYWVVPMLTFTQVLVRFGALCEHRYNVHGAKPETTTPMIMPLWWEKILVPNLNFNLHIYHHFFPAASFSHLPEIHKIFEKEGLVAKQEVFHGYADYFRRAVFVD